MKRFTARLLQPLLRRWTLLSKPVTLGVRLVALDEQGRIFLVRHTYRDGWYLPGGAVDRGETAMAAAIREAREEGHLVCESEPVLSGIFRNPRVGRDHVLLFRCDRARQSTPRSHDWEIAETGFFALDGLPEGTTPATRRRLAELFGGVRAGQDW